MKTNLFVQGGAMLSVILAFMLFISMQHMATGNQQDERLVANFETYRQAIKDAFHIDINGFKDSLKGGIADGKSITAYDLEELLIGIKFEMEHTSDRFIALELAMDHLERIPDYYSRLRRLERDFMSDRLLRM
jgi:hypothetical protein